MGKEPVHLPFKHQFKDLLLSGQKTCTSRTHAWGQVGDKFQAFDAVFEITGIEMKTLHDVATQLYKEEGFITPGEFVSIWNEIHTNMGFLPKQKVFVHHFRKVV